MGANSLASLPAAFQDAALDPSLWPALLFDISQNVGGAGAVLFNTEQRATIAPCSPDLGKMHEAYFKDEWFKLDTRYRGIPLMLRKGIVSEPEFITESEIRKDVFYKDFAERHGRRWFAGLGFRAGDAFWCLSVQRATTRGPFQADELERLRALLRAFGDAATLSRTIGQAWLDGMSRALDVVGHAAFVCDHQARVVDVNRAALDLGALAIGKDRHVRLASSAADDTLAAMLRSALRPFPIKGSGPATCRVSLPGCDLTFRAIRLDGHARTLFSGAALLVLMKRERIDPEAFLAATYHLTRAETRVALGLASGETITSMANSFRVRPDTVRAQLKAVYAKTGTQRQSQLVALIGRLAAQAQDGSIAGSIVNVL